ncbi:unnamed protein product [Heterobilharzia americana]|nr:unnamed protein product [Heterobilharzia americana]
MTPSVTCVKSKSLAYYLGLHDKKLCPVTEYVAKSLKSPQAPFTWLFGDSNVSDQPFFQVKAINALLNLIISVLIKAKHYNLDTLDTLIMASTCFTFQLQSLLEAKVTYNKIRSAHKIHFPDFSQDCLWNTPAPDFSLYKWNSRESMKPKSKESQKREGKNTENWSVESNDYSLNREIHPKLKFIRAIRPFTAKILFVRCGSFKPGPYTMPKPHDYRGLTPTNESKCPKFITSYEKDPMNINFLKKRQQSKHNHDYYGLTNIVWGINCDETIIRKVPQSFLKPLEQSEKWNKKLYLPSEPYPNREKCFTRHQLQFRDPHEVFLDKVGEKLETLWKRQRDRTAHLSRRTTVAW